MSESVIQEAVVVSRQRRVAEGLTGRDLRAIVHDLLLALGENPDREGLAKTPDRMARALKELTAGYGRDVETIMNGARFTERYDEMVLVKGIDFYSLCEHHLLPFFGTCHVAYLPDGRIVGLSKIPRLVECFARRLQIQERLTNQIAETLQGSLQPRGVAVVMEARHLCMMMRGVAKQNATMVTSSMLGRFRTDPKTRSEFFALTKSMEV